MAGRYPTQGEALKFVCNLVNLDDWGGFEGLKAEWKDHVEAQLATASASSAGGGASE